MSKYKVVDTERSIAVRDGGYGTILATRETFPTEHAAHAWIERNFLSGYWSKFEVRPIRTRRPT
jgi:hypothetical protein